MRLAYLPAAAGVALLFFTEVPAQTSPPQTTPSAQRPHVFLLMGQSNMVGWACSTPKDPWQPGDDEPESGISMLGGGWNVLANRMEGQMTMQPASHPLHRVVGAGHFGLGMDFARTYRQKNKGVDVILIPCGFPGMRIQTFMQGTAHFANTVARAKMAAQAGDIKGILWHQGESDTATLSLAKSYASKLDQLIADLRSEAASPDTPFLVGGMAPFFPNSLQGEQLEGFYIVLDALRGLPKRVPRTAFVESKGLTGIDQVHFNRSSQIELGQRYAAALADLLATPTQKLAPAKTPARFLPSPVPQS